MKTLLIGIFSLLLSSSAIAGDLLSERKGFETTLEKMEKHIEPLPIPPDEIFQVVKFKTEIGEMSAYLSRHSTALNEKRPAIVWLTGGFPSCLPGDYLWSNTEFDNEQSARIFRQLGIVMMFPTLRGRLKENPGNVEHFYGEVTDVISAGKYLRGLDYVDPRRVYLGGHSTGGTLALLVSEATDIFAGVICLGPSSDHYGKERAPYVWKEKEIHLRSPKNFLSYISSPTYIIEGELGKARDLKELLDLHKKAPNDNVHIAFVRGANHFNVIHPVNAVFAKAILESKNGTLSINMREQIEPAYVDYVRTYQETTDLKILAGLRSDGRLIEGRQNVQASFYAWKEEHLNSLIEDARKQGIAATKIRVGKAKNGKTYFATNLYQIIQIDSLGEVFSLSRSFRKIAERNDLIYNYWTIADE